jgi:hypothetical protein
MMAAASPNLELLTQALPLEDAVRIELREGVSRVAVASESATARPRLDPRHAAPR